MREVSTEEPEGLGSSVEPSRRVMRVEEYWGRFANERAVETGQSGGRSMGHEERMMVNKRSAEEAGSTVWGSR